jgi:hypothetical protein
MLVTCRSKSWSNITMCGDVAVCRWTMLGQCGTVPGALRAGDVPAALARLKQELATVSPEHESGPNAAPAAEDADAPPVVGLRLRAYPLIQLLSAAAQQECDVMWDEEHSAV